MNRRDFLILTGALAGAACAACRRSTGPQTIRVSAHPYFSMSGLYLAKELGYFEEAGLQVEIERIANSSQAIPLAVGGKLDVLFTGASAALVNAIARGSRLRIIAGREFAAPGCSDLYVVYGRRSVFPGGLQDLKTLRGKRIAADRMLAVSHFGIDMVLASAGLTTDELGVIQIGKAESVTALLSGKVDAIIVSDFDRRFAGVKDQIVRGISLADVLPNYQASYVVYGTRLLDGDPEIASNFLSAYLHGTRDYLGGQTPKFFDDLAISYGTDPAKARLECRANIVPDGRIDLPSLERFIGWAASRRLCQPVDAAKMVDLRFLEMQRRSSLS